MAIKNFNAQGAAITWGTSAFSGILLSISATQQSREVLDVSDLSIAKGGAKKSLPADLYDAGSFDMEFLFSGVQAVLPTFAVGETMTITFPKSISTATTGASFTGTGFVSSRSTTECSVGGVMQISCTFTWDGETAPVYAAES